MKVKVYLEIQVPKPKRSYHNTKLYDSELYDFVSSHLFGGIVKENSPFKGELKKLSMFIDTDND